MTNPTTSAVALRTARNISLDCLRHIQPHLPSQAKTVAIAAIASGVILSNSSPLISNLSFVIAAGAAIVQYTGKEQQVKAAIAMLIQSWKKASIEQRETGTRMTLIEEDAAFRNNFLEQIETVTRTAIIQEEYDSFTSVLRANPETNEFQLQ